METSILNSTKKILGLSEDYTAFDLDIITHINSTFAVVHQLGLGPAEGFFIDSPDAVWGDLGLSKNETNLVRTYVFLKVRMLFDPPNTSFLIEAMNHQIEEHECRLSYYRENPVSFPVIEEEVIVDG